MPESPRHLFVYGTLRHGRHEMARLLEESALAVGGGSVQGCLYLVEDYPGATWSDDPRQQVRGEVYRLLDGPEVLRRLDEYEDYRPENPRESLFLRRVTDVQMDDGTSLPAWIYLYNRPIHGLPTIRSGDFVDVEREVRRAKPA